MESRDRDELCTIVEATYIGEVRREKRIMIFKDSICKYVDISRIKERLVDTRKRKVLYIPLYKNKS